MMIAAASRFGACPLPANTHRGAVRSRVCHGVNTIDATEAPLGITWTMSGATP